MKWMVIAAAPPGCNPCDRAGRAVGAIRGTSETRALGPAPASAAASATDADAEPGSACGERGDDAARRRASAARDRKTRSSPSASAAARRPARRVYRSAAAAVAVPSAWAMVCEAGRRWRIERCARGSAARRPSTSPQEDGTRPQSAKRAARSRRSPRRRRTCAADADRRRAGSWLATAHWTTGMAGPQAVKAADRIGVRDLRSRKRSPPNRRMHPRPARPALSSVTALTTSRPPGAQRRPAQVDEARRRSPRRR